MVAAVYITAPRRGTAATTAALGLILAACSGAPVATPPGVPSSAAASSAVVVKQTTGPASPSPASGRLPSHGRIAFNLEFGPDGDAYKEIWTIEPDGSDARQLTVYSKDGLAAEPAWTPDGTRIVFVSGDVSGDNGSHLYSIPAAGGAWVQLTARPGFEWSPAISPDGTLIACTGDPGHGNERVYLMRSDGSDRVELAAPVTSSADGAGFPDFSPDGRQLAFELNGALDVIGTDGTGLREVLPASAGVHRPRWSPDGTRFVFEVAEQRPNTGHLMVVNVDGSGLHDVGSGGEPDWSPDGQWLVYHRYREGTHFIALVVAHADGSDPLEIWHTRAGIDNFIQGSDWGTAP